MASSETQETTILCSPRSPILKKFDKESRPKATYDKKPMGVGEFNLMHKGIYSSSRYKENGDGRYGEHPYQPHRFLWQKEIGKAERPDPVARVGECRNVGVQ